MAFYHHLPWPGLDGAFILLKTNGQVIHLPLQEYELECSYYLLLVDKNASCVCMGINNDVFYG